MMPHYDVTILPFQLKEFAKAHQSEFGGASKVVLQQIEKTDGNVAWMKHNYEPIMDWLSQGS